MIEARISPDRAVLIVRTAASAAAGLSWVVRAIETGADTPHWYLKLLTDEDVAGWTPLVPQRTEEMTS